MGEIWKKINDYEDYAVSSLGRVKSLKYGKERILKQSRCTGGYLYVFLCMGNRVKSFRVHRLVAIAFLDNPDNLPEVNHKDENIENNCIENLEWAESRYNKNYGSRVERIAKAKTRKIEQIDAKTGKCIAVFDGGKDAAKSVGLKSPAHIYECCRGGRDTSGGYVWRWQP